MHEEWELHWKLTKQNWIFIKKEKSGVFNPFPQFQEFKGIRGLED